MTSGDPLDEGSSMRTELRPLDPDVDPLAAERFAMVVMARIGAAHAVARVPADPLYGLWSLPRPLLFAASIIAVALVGAASRSGAASARAPATIAESIGVPSPFLVSEAPHR